MGQVHHALYKYGKVLSNYMIFNDFDEYMYVPKQKIKNLIKSKHNTYMFLNKWCKTLDFQVPDKLPSNILISTEEYKPGKQSKCIIKTLAHSYIGVHHPTNTNNILVQNDMLLLHFINWSNSERSNGHKYITFNLA
jgi:hypothetical protein